MDDKHVSESRHREQDPHSGTAWRKSNPKHKINQFSKGQKGKDGSWESSGGTCNVEVELSQIILKTTARKRNMAKDKKESVTIE